MSRRRLPLAVQIGYSTAEIGVNLVETMLRIYTLAYYTDHVALDAGLAGLAVGLAIVWDAVTDPVMGVISDRTRHRFGGRRGYLPVGAVLLALGVFAVFWPPALAGQAGKFAWLLGAYCFLNTGLTVLTVPYMAMAGEITEDPHERAVLFGWRFACANFGALAAAALPFLFLADGQSGPSVMPAVSVTAAGVVLLTALVSWRATRGVRFLGLPIASQSWRETFTAPLLNPAFRPLLLAYVIATAGIGVNAATFLYYYQYHLELAAQSTQTVLAVFLAVFTLSILPWVHVAKRYGKRRPMICGATFLGVGTTLLYLFAPTGAFALVLVAGAIGLGSLVGCIVLIDAMLTDVLDHDMVRTGQMRSGMFFGVWRFASKLARAVAVGAVGLLLGFAGFVEGGSTQPAAVDATLVALFGPGVGGAFLLAAVVLWRYRFDDPKQAQVRRILARRAARGASIPPACPTEA
jgi:GPH family glycoside/pentoside/hexuronide:cation symporter